VGDEESFQAGTIHLAVFNKGFKEEDSTVDSFVYSDFEC